MPAAGATALPLSRVEPRLTGVDHHRGQRDFVIAGVLANPLVKIDREADGRVTKPLAVLRLAVLSMRTTKTTPLLPLKTFRAIGVPDPRT